MAPVICILAAHEVHGNILSGVYLHCPLVPIAFELPFFRNTGYRMEKGEPRSHTKPIIRDAGEYSRCSRLECGGARWPVTGHLLIETKLWYGTTRGRWGPSPEPKAPELAC